VGKRAFLLMVVALTLPEYQYRHTPMVCKEFGFWMGEGDREEKDKIVFQFNLKNNLPTSL